MKKLWGLTFGTLAACGGVDVDRVAVDFEHPSGSVSDRAGLAGASVSVDAVGPAMSLAPIAGRINPYGLTSSEARRGLARLELLELLGPALREWSALAAKDPSVEIRRFGLTSLGGGLDDCYDPTSIKTNTSVGFTSVSSGFELTLELGRCTSDLSGVLHLAAEGRVSAGSVRVETELRFEEVCEKVGAEACVDGVMLSRLELEAAGGQTVSTLGFVQGYDLSGSWLRAGARESARTKGGLRMKGKGLGEGQLEILCYVETDAGEVSYVLEASSAASGRSLKIRGADGSIECTASADGAGQCTGSVSWSADDVAIARARQGG